MKRVAPVLGLMLLASATCAGAADLKIFTSRAIATVLWDIGTVEAFKRALLNAKSITYLPVPGVPQMIERLGLADALKARSVIPDTDIASELVAKGEVELGIVVITQILTTPGVELVGPLPSELKIATSFAGAASADSKAPEAARNLIAFLKAPQAVKVMRAQGMEPLF